MLLTGSAVAGKTATVHVLPNELGFEVQEWSNPLSETEGKSTQVGLSNICTCTCEKGRGCLSEILKGTPNRYQGFLGGAWLELFSPLRSTNFKITHYSASLVIVFWD